MSKVKVKGLEELVPLSSIEIGTMFKHIGHFYITIDQKSQLLKPCKSESGQVVLCFTDHSLKELNKGTKVIPIDVEIKEV